MSGIGRAIGHEMGRQAQSHGGVAGFLAGRMRGEVGRVERALELADEKRFRCINVESQPDGTTIVVLQPSYGADTKALEKKADIIAGALGADVVYQVARRGQLLLCVVGPHMDFPSERTEYASSGQNEVVVTHHAGGDTRTALAAYPRVLEMFSDAQRKVDTLTHAGLVTKETAKAKNPDGSPVTITTLTLPTFERLHIGPTGLMVVMRGAPGQTINTYKAALPQLQTAWNAPKLSVSEPEGGTFLLAFNDTDPLDGGDYRLQGPHRYDADAGRSLLGIGADGREVWISWADNSGMVVAGAPGTGKTASLLPVLAGMAGQVELHLADGKGMFDWEGISPICRTYIRSGKPEAPQEMLRRVYAASKRRGEAVYRLTGESNFWNLNRQQRRELGVTPIFIILDECQKYLDWSGMEKDEKQVIATNRKYVREMVQEGRSAGVVVILITQKPTSESIPTIIRDNAALRLSYYVRSSAAATAVLGTGRGEGAPSPERDIKNGQLGRFVYDDTERGVAVLGQSFFLPGKEALPIMERWNPVPDQAELADDLLRRAGISVDDVALDVDEPASTPAPAPKPKPAKAAPKAKAPAPAPEPEPEPTVSEAAQLVAAMTPEEREALVREIAIERGWLQPDAADADPASEVEEPAASEPAPTPEPTVTVAEEIDNTDDPFAGL